MPNKDNNRVHGVEFKSAIIPPQHAINTAKAVNSAAKSIIKINVKETPISPVPPPSQNMEEDSTELLGSLTTEQQQRTSARVIKKLRLEPLEREKRDIPECETPNKIEDKDPLKFPTVKQRMPKAIWSTDEKNLFFEALNEYGKDFDAITSYICAKLKKKGMPDLNLKTKTQVSHFYYRTWHKLSKHVQFDENVKKVAQELYALINYGELRKKLVSVNEKVCSRLGEMVLGGSMMLRYRGKNLRVRTPMCRALRRLNQISEGACGPRTGARVAVSLRARSAAAWARVQAAAHNPRAHVALHMRVPLAALLHALHKRWRNHLNYKLKQSAVNHIDLKNAEESQKEEDYQDVSRQQNGVEVKNESEDLESHLNLETDLTIIEEQNLPKKPVLHVGPRPNAEINLPVITLSEQLSSQKICLSSYLERMYSQRRDKEDNAKIRTPKRQRKDSATEKEVEQKKPKVEEVDMKLMNIDETAIDGIELMANYKNIQEDEEKRSTEDEKDIKCEIVEEDGDREKEMSEKEKDSFSEMEDDEKYTKSDTDNESDQGKVDKSEKDAKFKNLKVKFRIRSKKCGGSIYTLVTDKEEKVETTKDEESKCDFDVETAIQQIRKGWSMHDAGDLTIGDLYLMFGSRSKLELDYWWAVPTPPLPQPLKFKQIEQEKNHPVIEKEKKVEKTPDKGADISVEDGEKRESDTDILSPKNFGQDSNDGLSGDERKGEQVASPEHKMSASTTFKLGSKLINRPVPQPPPNGFALLGDRLKRLLALAGNPHVGGAPGGLARCSCGHVCLQHDRHKQKAAQLTPRFEEASTVFRHPTPIAPKPDAEGPRAVSLEDVPRWRRGRPAACGRVVVQRLLPLLPKLPPSNKLIPVKVVSESAPAPPRILPRPPPAPPGTGARPAGGPERGGGAGGGRLRARPEDDPKGITVLLADEEVYEDDDRKDFPVDIGPTEVGFNTVSTNGEEGKGESKSENDIASAEFLPAECASSASLSPSRLLRDADWLGAHDFSLSSFLGHLEGRPQPDLAVDTQLQSLMVESSVDYIAKFADLAAEVTDEGLLADQLH